MGDPFKKVQRGDALRIPAETFNTFIDAVKDYRSRTQNRGHQSQNESQQSGIILVKFHRLGWQNRMDSDHSNSMEEN